MKNQLRAMLLVSLFAVTGVKGLDQRKNLAIIDQVLESLGVKCISHECLSKRAAESDYLATAIVFYDLSPYATIYDSLAVRDLYFQPSSIDCFTYELRVIHEIPAVNIKVYGKCLQREFLLSNKYIQVQRAEISSLLELSDYSSSSVKVSEATTRISVEQARFEKLKKAYEEYIATHK